MRTSRLLDLPGLAVAAALTAWPGVAPAQAGNPSTMPTREATGAERPGRAGAWIEVVGEGRSDAVPDMAVIELGVVAMAPTAAEAVSRMTTEMRSVLEALGTDGIPARDIQTGQLSLQPRYRDPRVPDTGEAPEIEGYEAVNDLRVEVRDLGNLGRILDSVVRSGANRVANLSFMLADPDAAMDAALVAAVSDATRKARLIAEAAGLRLGPVLRIGEGEITGGPGPMMMMESRIADVPVMPGEIDLRARVRMVFALADADGAP